MKHYPAYQDWKLNMIEFCDGHPTSEIYSRIALNCITHNECITVTSILS